MQPTVPEGYTLVKTIESNGAVMKVYRPILTEDEKLRRMREIYQAAKGLLKELKR